VPLVAVGVFTRNSSQKIQREHAEPKKNSRTSDRGVIASSSGVKLIEKRSSPISMNEHTRLSTSEG